MPALRDRIRALLRRRSDPKTIISVQNDRRVVVASILIILLLGLPLWWTTTRVYRAELPATEIADFSPDQVLTVPFSFYIDAPTTIAAEAIEHMAQKLIDERRAAYAPSEWRVRYTARVRHKITAPDVPGHYTLRLREAAKESVVFDVGRVAHVSVGSNTEKRDARVARLVADIVAKEERELREKGGARRALKYAPEYSVTFTLLNEDPVGGAAVSWDIEHASDSYVRPFADALRPLAQLAVSTQVLHHAGPPPVTPLAHSNGTYLTPDMLPHFANSPWWNLASIDPIAPAISFILYVPALRSQPLHIVDDAKRPSATNAFVVAQWGGIAIANLPIGTAGDVVISHDELQKYFGVFIAQLRELVGIRNDTPLLPSAGVSVRRATTTGISAWELDALMRQWMVANRQTAITTLQSLVRLVQSMENMVVMDEIKTQVDQSLSALHSISHALAHDISHLRAFELAANASRTAEGAFFDPSMVSLLYFPDQHKYAIYLPFFLPVAIPLLSAIKKAIRKESKNDPKPAAASDDKKNE
ncbi:GPI transamidase component [Coemansia furcata]|uniref:GPI transamidase component n=1 Tax=Coemansia furcata TaxID=417177 RepID=A0ACC1LN49_9FUNG|nr:GPI transamidase component [Coemansia furcata]